MKKTLLILAVLSLIASPAYADREEHGRDYGRGHEHHDYDRGEEHRGWFFVVPPPLWAPVNPVCRDYTTSHIISDENGNQYIITEQHTECLDAYGQWRVVR